MGPEPMTSTCRRSSRLGMFYELPEAVEEVVGVVRSGRGLRVVLHREGRYVERAEPFDHVVVQADVAHLDRTEVGVDPPFGRSANRAVLDVAVHYVHRAVLDVAVHYVHREAMVVRGHLDLAGGPVQHRLVHATVAVAGLVGAETERPAEDLAG